MQTCKYTLVHNPANWYKYNPCNYTDTLIQKQIMQIYTDTTKTMQMYTDTTKTLQINVSVRLWL